MSAVATIAGPAEARSLDVKIVAHRACHDLRHPENSMSAIARCIQNEIPIIEIDVRQTADGIPVLMHDGQIDRTTDRTGEVASLSLSELHQARLKNATGAMTLQRIPTLEEVLKLVAGRAILNLDVKGDARESALALVRKYHAEDWILFKEQWLDETSTPGLPADTHFMPIILDCAAQKREGCNGLRGLDAVNSHASDLFATEVVFEDPASIQGLSERVAKSGVRLWVNTLGDTWSLAGGLNDAQALKDPDAVWGTLIKSGFEFIQTDYPLALKSYLNSGNPPMAKWRGVDLSYVNEMEDCGATYSDSEGRTDPYKILAAAGANVVRLRLWHSPQWTDYSDLPDVIKSIKRANGVGMRVLLDFHFSDDWADPSKQIIPSAWAKLGDDQKIADELAHYVAATLETLYQNDALPEYVQIGNETNSEMLRDEEAVEGAPINWERNAKFLNAGLGSVEAFNRLHGTDVKTMLHIAQPENVEPWFDDARKSGVVHFDIIGVSYYEKWSSVPLASIGKFVSLARQKYGKDVVVVETSYPWTLSSNDKANNLLGEDSLTAGYSASRAGQQRYLIDLQSAIVANGGLGLVYWEPAWVSTKCATRWGEGSHWENATLFNFEGQLLPGADFLRTPDGK